ncbi:RecB-like helicase [Sulfurospirillum barnesii]|uniref:DNA 3'-5' helicase n=1 Tax=Sulfurospirillum barnesii (strain ATCC 700032 / DSM 10660 / SES-3) TaxID=760154 RepID=I3XZC9_SULBS|nr:RecB-like helicase [Sulfurospirillum barnesii]AFL69303.1 ATP-dependent exonuclase V beta subunit, helicase and exonuclease domain-containing [Sulfurospirillum barnesii SES-3]
MNFSPYLALEASAGSGKTFALSVRYLSLLFMGANPQKIVALTFTNKSASEMKIRIFETLKHLQNKDELEAISIQTGMSKEMLLYEKERVLKDFLEADIKIATLDSFFSLILRHFALHVGLQPDFKVGQNTLDEVLVERFIAQCKRHNLYHALIAFSLYEDKKLSDIFSLLNMLYQKKSELNIRAFHEAKYPSLQPCLELLARIREHFERSGLSERGMATLKAQTLRDLLAKKYLEKEDFGYWDYKKHANEEVNALLGELKEALSAHVNAKEAYILGELGKLFSVYDESLSVLMREYGELAFDDVSNVLYTLLREEISRAFLYFRLDGSIEHLLIDEFQDTSIVQYQILLPIIEEIRAGQGVKAFKTLFFVGDVKQSIYRFRGGAKELFDYAKETLHLDVNSLDTNYRSTYEVVQFVNEIFTGKIKGYTAQKVAKEQRDGYINVRMDERIESFVLEAIERLLKEGVMPKDIALLVHTNKDANVLKGLVQEHFPFLHVRLEATLKLIEVRSIKALISLLKYLYFGDELYKAAFFVLSGKRWDTPLHRNLWNVNESPYVLMEKLIRSFELFDGSSDCLAFLEVASRYEEIESFLFDLETLSTEAKSEDTDGLRILTVHKSKGLEFEHVILCDKLGRDNNRSDTLLFSYDEVNLQGLYVSMSGRESVDTLYATAKDKENLLNDEDRLNALYVAFTRAKHSLFVCAKSEHSAFEILNLTPLERGVLHASFKELPQAVPPMSLFLPERYGSQDIYKAEEEEREWEVSSMTFGIAQHYLLEMLDDFNEKALERAYLALQNRFAPLLDETALKSLYKRALNLVTCKEFLSLLKGARVHKEQPLIYQQERKQIDLLLEFSDKIIVIDYKSSKKQSAKHHAQVKLYQEALMEIYSLPVEGYICYLSEEKVELIKNLYNT